MKPGNESNDCLLIDGYNLMYAMKPDIDDIEYGRDMLIDRVADYAGYTGSQCILVFDAQRGPDRKPRHITLYGIQVVFTARGQTADTYIEALCHELSAQGQSVSVVSGDGLIQSLVQGMGALRCSSREFVLRMESAVRQSEQYQPAGGKRYLYRRLSDELMQALERMRR